MKPVSMFIYQTSPMLCSCTFIAHRLPQLFVELYAQQHRTIVEVRMEIDKLTLENSNLLKDVTEILSGFLLDKDTLDRVRKVFKQEMALGLQYGLEKVNYLTTSQCIGLEIELYCK